VGHDLSFTLPIAHDDSFDLSVLRANSAGRRQNPWPQLRSHQRVGLRHHLAGSDGGVGWHCGVATNADPALAAAMSDGRGRACDTVLFRPAGRPFARMPAHVIERLRPRSPPQPPHTARGQAGAGAGGVSWRKVFKMSSRTLKNMREAYQPLTFFSLRRLPPRLWRGSRLGAFVLKSSKGALQP
jgi:hypothetical protein